MPEITYDSNGQPVVTTDPIDVTLDNNGMDQVIPNVPIIEPQHQNGDSGNLLKNPAVIALLEKVREQEKNKLYKVIGQKDETVSKLKEEVVKLSGQLNEKDQTHAQEVAQMQERLTKLDEAFTALNGSIEAEREAAKKEKRDAELSAYKERRLREVSESGDNLVTALVGGQTEEEIEASIEKAKAEFEKIASLVSSNQPTPPVVNTPRVTNPPSMGDSVDFSSIRNMTPAEYAKHREKILNAARSGQLS